MKRNFSRKPEVDIFSVGLTKCWELQEIWGSKAEGQDGETNKAMMDVCAVLQQHLIYLGVFFVAWYSKNVSLLKYFDLDLK